MKTDHEGLVAAGVRDFVHRSDFGIPPQLPKLLSDALRNAPGRAVLACVSDEYRHLFSLLSGRRHPPLYSFTSRSKSPALLAISTKQATSTDSHR